MKTESEIRAEIERARTMPTGSSQAISHQISYTQALEWVLIPSASPQTDEELVEAMAVHMAADIWIGVPWEKIGRATKDGYRDYARKALFVAREQIERKARDKALDDAAKRIRVGYWSSALAEALPEAIAVAVLAIKDHPHD